MRLRVILDTASRAACCRMRSWASCSSSPPALSCADPTGILISASVLSAAQRFSKMLQLRADRSMSKFKKISTRVSGVFSNQDTISLRTLIWWSGDTTQDSGLLRSTCSIKLSAMTASSSRMCLRNLCHSVDTIPRTACSTRMSHMQFTAFWKTTMLRSRLTRYPKTLDLQKCSPAPLRRSLSTSRPSSFPARSLATISPVLVRLKGATLALHRTQSMTKRLMCAVCPKIRDATLCSSDQCVSIPLMCAPSC
mmetsp:Transcript_2961/g.11996  ORF Transcript_2961/g.11996 Transcript_2961/m.11996 type:complete len:252 (+) Transcript_2961:2957-3712(+)